MTISCCLLNAHHEQIPFKLPGGTEHHWQPLVDTTFETGIPPADTFKPEAEYPLQGRSLALLRRTRA